MTLIHVHMCIGGEWVDALSGKICESLTPALAELPNTDEANAERALQAAFDSPAWWGLTATARGKLLAENKEGNRDNGKLIRETRGQVG